MAVDSTATGSERRRLRQDRRIVAPSRSRRVPVAVGVGMLMAFVVGWVAVRAFNSEPAPRRTSAAVFTPSAPASTPGTLRTAATLATPPPAPSAALPASPAATPASAPRETESPEESEGSVPGTVPSAAGRAASPRAPSSQGAPIIVRPETDTAVSTPEDRAERGSRVAALRRALHRRDAVSRRCEELRRQLDVGVITDTEEYQRTQALLDEALDELERLDAEVARLKAEITGG